MLDSNSTANGCPEALGPGLLLPLLLSGTCCHVVDDVAAQLPQLSLPWICALPPAGPLACMLMQSPFLPPPHSSGCLLSACPPPCWCCCWLRASVWPSAGGGYCQPGCLVQCLLLPAAYATQCQCLALVGYQQGGLYHLPFISIASD